MATATPAKRPSKPAAKQKADDRSVFRWTAIDKQGQQRRGEMRAAGGNSVTAALRRQGMRDIKVKKVVLSKGGVINDSDISLLTRQIATMMQAGVPLLQSFDITSKGASKPAVAYLVQQLRQEVETGSALHQAFRQHPKYFDSLFCNLVEAGEKAGILDDILERLATYKEKILAIKKKIKSALFYPIAVIAVAVIVTGVILIFVIPQFKITFESFGATLPGPTVFVINLSDFVVKNWWKIGGVIAITVFLTARAYKRSRALQILVDRISLKLPVFGPVLLKATVARWARTLSTMFAAGVPLVEALESVGGAAGNYVYESATKKIQSDVSAGVSLTVSMENVHVFPSMCVQMVSIGEESGSLDAMLSKVADFYEQEVDNAVEAMSKLIEPMLMVVLGTVIGGLVVAMYLPIFKVAQAI